MAPGTTLHTLRATHVAMDSIVEVTVVADSTVEPDALFEEVFAEVDRIDRLASFFDARSALSRLNTRATSVVTAVDSELVVLLRSALDVSDVTGGAFDPTVGELSRLWGFIDKRYRIPSAAEISGALMSVGYKRVQVLDSTSLRFRHRRTQLILGGIAKGYAVDRSLEVLRRPGVDGALVNIAGDLRAFGNKADGSIWRLGIRHPRQHSRLLGTMSVTDLAVATSGDYERCFFVDGVRYHHIMDPWTGHPASGCRSVTIVTPSALWADALATAVFVLGPEHGMELIERRDAVEGLIVSADGRLLRSSGFHSFGFRLQSSP